VPISAPISNPIELHDVRASRGGATILNGVSFSVAPGDTVALLGRNGMGKTTTLDCIAGRVAVMAGRISVLGGPCDDRPHRLVRRGLGYVPEIRGIFANLTVGEHLRVSKRRGGSWPAERLVDLFPALKDRLADKAGRLSGGQQQMVAIARALSSDPLVLMLDEPTAGLAPLVIEDITRALLEVQKSRLTLLIVEQTVAIASQLGHRFLFMEEGRIVAQTDATGFAADPALFDRHLGVHL
jgi:branched-chain amino acid transport system ATP-binding protein